MDGSNSQKVDEPELLILLALTSTTTTTNQSCRKVRSLWDEGMGMCLRPHLTSLILPLAG